MNYLNMFICYLHLRIISILNPSSRITCKGFSLISNKANIEVAKNTDLMLGKGLHLRSGVVLSVRSGALLKLGDGVFINRNTIVTSRKSIIIEDGVTIGPNVCIYDHDHDMSNRGGYILDSILIKRNAWIGSGVIILKGVVIGESAVIASGSIVTKDVPAYTVLIQKRNNEYTKTNTAEK